MTLTEALDVKINRCERKHTEVWWRSKFRISVLNGLIKTELQ